MSKVVLVTGATGFIGRVLVGNLRQAHREVLALGSADGDVRLKETFSRLDGARIAHVFHLAARTYVPEGWDDPGGFIETNVLGTSNALEFCKRVGASITFVSAYVYGAQERLPIAETAHPRPNNPYAISKMLAEELCRFYAEHYSVPVGIARLFNVYGPGQRPEFLLPTLIRQAREDREIRVADLEPRRDYLYLDDVVDALVRLADRRPDFRIYNVASGTSLSVGDIIAAVQSVLGTAKPVVCLSAVRQNEIPDTAGDASRARSELGWHAKTGFTEGIAMMAGG